MIPHSSLSTMALFRLLKSQQIQFAGHKKWKIYGKLKCRSGKRMKKENRVFFNLEADAKAAGYRPCGHCMPIAYQQWKMELFARDANANKNLLPQDGEVYYHGRVVNLDQANALLEDLLKSIAWEHDQAKIFGKTIITKRKVAWYGDFPFPYRYSGTEKIALPWNDLLQTIKQLAELHSGETYNSCLLNLYHSGEEGMAWHSDDEKELQKDSTIASLSFGADRKFAFKHRQTKERIDLWLEHGSLLTMKGTTQTHWVHRLPPTKKVKLPRVNLTFRQMNPLP